MQTLGKEERLKSKKSIDTLFVENSTCAIYPLRILYRLIPHSDALPRVLISVPKKRLKHATDRNLVRRRLREAYRLHRNDLYAHLAHQHCSLEIAFIYVENNILDYAPLENKMKALLVKLVEQVSN